MNNNKYFIGVLKNDYERYTNIYNITKEDINKCDMKIKDLETGKQKGNYEKGYTHPTTDIDKEEAKATKKKIKEEKEKINELYELKKSIFVKKLEFKKYIIYLCEIEPKINIKKNGKNVMFMERHNEKYEEFAQIDIGKSSKEIGKLELIGEFEPSEKNIKNIKYQHFKKGKKDFNDAYLSLNGITEEQNKNQKIDITDFFRLKFKLAEQGIQSRAYYEKNNCIIDGSAGTGKSTIAIQKLEYFYTKFKEQQERMLIIIKNKNLEKDFKTLLDDKELNLSSVKIRSIQDMIRIDKFSYKQLKKSANKIIYFINNKINNINNRDIKSLEEHYHYLLDFIGKDFIKKSIEELIASLKINNNFKISTLIDEQ